MLRANDLEEHTLSPFYDAVSFGYRYADPKARLRAILRNMCQHGGVFVPPAMQECA